MPVLRSILVAAVLAGLSVSGMMRQCCAAGCAAHGFVTVVPPTEDADACPDACCAHKSWGGTEPAPCCPFGKQCGDEAERGKTNPASHSTGHAATPVVPDLVADHAAFARIVSVETSVLLAALSGVPDERPLSPLASSSCRRN
jgi:hypothetical protein